MHHITKKLLFIAAVATVYAPPTLASALQDGANNAQPTTKNEAGQVVGSGPTDLQAMFGTIANILVFLVGAIAVLVIIVGGLRYVTSTGDAARVKAAKDTVFYGVVGLVVALLAYAIVNLVVEQLN